MKKIILFIILLTNTLVSNSQDSSLINFVKSRTKTNIIRNSKYIGLVKNLTEGEEKKLISYININKDIDPFTNEIHIYSDYNYESSYYNEYPDNDITVHKYINKGIESYYLSIEIGSSGIYRGNGVYILFEDGTKWSKPYEKIDINYYSNSFNNSVFIKINKNDLLLFKEKSIKIVRLYIHDKDMRETKSLLFRLYISLIINKK
jgi:hypothetical protein